jgi:hypothetical protein
LCVRSKERVVGHKDREDMAIETHLAIGSHQVMSEILRLPVFKEKL